jgi:hypothetical protein
MLNPQQIAKEIQSNENKNRKQIHQQLTDILDGRIYTYLKSYIHKILSKKTADKMPIIASVNLASRIIDYVSQLYTKAPTRTFNGVSDQHAEILNNIYANAQINHKMGQLQALMNYHGQCFAKCIPSNGQLALDIIRPQHIDAIPSDTNLNTASAFIYSTYDWSEIPSPTESTKDGLVKNAANLNDKTNQVIADPNDGGGKRLAIWTASDNMLTNDEGKILVGPYPNPIQMLPFLDANIGKQLEFFIRKQSDEADQTIIHNFFLSMVGFIVEVQGFSQAYLKGQADMMPTQEGIEIGPTQLLLLKVDPGSQIVPEFGYAQPGSDLAGAQKYIDMILSQYLTSKGIDPKVVISDSSQSRSYSSGYERYIANQDQWKHSEKQIPIFEQLEQQLFSIITAWLRTSSGNDLLLPEYRANIPESASISVKFNGPELNLTEKERLEIIREKIELGIMSKAEAIMFDRGIPKEEAQKVIMEIDEGNTSAEVLTNGKLPGV